MVRCDIVISISMIVIINVRGLIGISIMSISRVILGVLLKPVINRVSPVKLLCWQ